MVSASDVARYLLLQQDQDEGDLISNLKLQKLLFYSQGYHLAIFDKPLFKEQIKAWDHGPVVPQVYHEYKEFGAHAIDLPEGFDSSLLTQEERGFLDEVYRVFGQFSAWKLRDMTHDDAPYKETPKGGIITHSSMKQYFKKFTTTSK